jgi:hypothetical protein
MSDDSDYSSSDGGYDSDPAPQNHVPAAPSAGPRFTLSNAPQRQQSSVNEELGQDVRIVFELPDGRRESYTFKMGHTIEYLKLRLQEDVPGCSYAKVRLFAGSTLLADPLSLSDLRVVDPASENTIKVEIS